MRITATEADIQAAIIEAFWLKLRIRLDPIDAGGKGFRAASGGRGHSSIPAGFPDLLGAFPPHGTMVSIEVKRPGQKPTKAQTDFLKRRRDEGGIAYWADSVGSALEQFDAQWRMAV